MKIRLLIVCLLVSALLVIPAYAVEGDAAPSEEVTDPVSIETSKEEEGVTVNVTIQNPETVPAADAAETLLEDETVVDSDGESTSLQSNYSVSSLDVSSEVTEDSSMSQLVADIFGSYQRKTMTVSQYDAQGSLLSTSSEYVPGLAGLDWEWLAGVSIFTVFLYCVLRAVGGGLKR